MMRNPANPKIPKILIQTMGNKKGTGKNQSLSTCIEVVFYSDSPTTAASSLS